MKNIYFLPILIILFIGCTANPSQDTQWIAKEHYDRVIWADDGSEEVAIVNVKYEETVGGASNTPEKRNFKHQIITQKIDGSNKKVITDWRDHQNGSFYYMKQYGYFVIESLLDNGSRRFDKIDRNGNEILVIETPDGEHTPCAHATPITQDVIPSPDGALLAYIYSLDCDQITVEFLYANNLTTIDSQTLYDVKEPLNALWHPYNFILLTNNSLTNAWQVAVQFPPAPVSPPNCFKPITTSSPMSFDGRLVYLNESNEILTKFIGKEETFGCQSQVE